MKKSLLENALYQPIILILKQNPRKQLKGYLIKDQYNKKRYKILPLNTDDDIMVFPACYVKQYTYIISGVVIK